MDPWTRRVYDVVRAIPPGRVASYGLVALIAGRRGAARAVGNVMLECDDPSVPCHRVVHADGSLAPSFRAQRARLRREG
ncbi:MAG TPA: MGMT family protein, partial [Candidatus Limnocylindria bacterium]|nr:MGMT family protein [Candidatus Limnocylindria bacterium]